MILGVERQRCGSYDLIQMACVSRADDNARDARLIEYPPNRHRADPNPVAGGNRVETGQQGLESIPTAELVDDQAVLHQRSILERCRRLRLSKVLLREEPAGERAVTQQTDAVARAACGHLPARPPIEDRILHLV